MTTPRTPHAAPLASTRRHLVRRPTCVCHADPSAFGVSTSLRVLDSVRGHAASTAPLSFRLAGSPSPRFRFDATRPPVGFVAPSLLHSIPPCFIRSPSVRPLVPLPPSQAAPAADPYAAQAYYGAPPGAPAEPGFEYGNLAGPGSNASLIPGYPAAAAAPHAHSAYGGSRYDAPAAYDPYGGYDAVNYPSIPALLEHSQRSAPPSGGPSYGAGNVGGGRSYASKPQEESGATYGNARYRCMLLPTRDGGDIEVGGGKVSRARRRACPRRRRRRRHSRRLSPVLFFTRPRNPSSCCDGGSSVETLTLYRDGRETFDVPTERTWCARLASTVSSCSRVGHPPRWLSTPTPWMQ